VACSGSGKDTDEVYNGTGGSGGVTLQGGSGGVAAGGSGGVQPGGTGGAIAGTGGIQPGGTGGAIPGTGGAHQGGYPGGPGCVTQPATRTNPMIDDLEDGDDSVPSNDGRHGFWYTFNDGTGNQMPPTGQDNFLPNSPGANGTSYAAYTSGDSFVGYPEQNMQAFARMDMPIFQGAGEYCSYDASGYTGLSFYAKGNVPIYFRVTSVWTTPTNQGGFCAGICYDHHSIAITTLTSDWQLFSFTWSELVQWGLDGSVEPLDPTGLLELQWEVRGAAAAGPWEFAVDEIAFTGG
jgi:hypothetical protein